MIPFAVHIADGVLTAPWLLGGFALAALLVLLGSLRIRDEEIPRIALLTAAFFVASLLHIRVGPTSVHLLLNGLVGVVLGRRAAPAILVGLFLQAALIGHGGFLTLGVNTCVLVLPALLAGVLFARCHRANWLRAQGMRPALVAVCVAVWTLGLVYVVTVVWTNRKGDWSNPNLDTAKAVILHPAVLGAACVLALGSAHAVRRLDGSAEFVLGLLVGAGAVLATAVLNALVLLLGGVEDWRSLALFVFATHLPLAVIEGVILGFAVAFLARVKPEMLGESTTAAADEQPSYPLEPVRPPVLLLVVAGLLLTAAPVQAHRLNVDYKVLAMEHKVIVEAWFSRSDSPKNATVQVFRSDKRLLVEGKLDDEGVFAFSYEKADALRVVVNAPGGHREEVEIPAKKLDPSAEEPEKAPDSGGSFADRSERATVKDVLLGVCVLLSLAGFVLSVRNARALRRLK